jgi:hypothetical protein
VGVGLRAVRRTFSEVQHDARPGVRLVLQLPFCALKFLERLLVPPKGRTSGPHHLERSADFSTRPVDVKDPIHFSPARYLNANKRPDPTRRFETSSGVSRRGGPQLEWDPLLEGVASLGRSGLPDPSSTKSTCTARGARQMRASPEVDQEESLLQALGLTPAPKTNHDGHPRATDGR